jgi:hypothetical protein
MRTIRPSIDRINKGTLVLLALLFAPAWIASSISAGSATPNLGSRLVGDTLSAVVYVQRSAAFAGDGSLRRFALQAYFRQDGSALVRVWVPARDAYTPTVERRWTVTGDRLCFDTPNPGPGNICAQVHVWGPRVAGAGTGPYVMVDGDLEPGNVIFRTR